MAQIKTKVLLGSGNISADRIVINRNFEILETIINDFQNYLNIDTKTLTGISSLELFNATPTAAAPNFIALNTNGSIRALGNAVITGNITGNIGNFVNGLSVEKGDITFSSTNSNINLNGHLNIGGELVLKDFGLDGTITAYSKTYFEQYGSAIGQNLLIQSGQNIIGGMVTMSGRNALILDWTGYNSSDITSDLTYIELMTNESLGTNPNLKVGQIVEIVALIPPVETPEFYVIGQTLKHPDYESTDFNIKFTKSYQSMRVVYDGTHWVILNLNGATAEEIV